MKKKIVSLLLTGAMAALLLSGCGGGTSSTSAPSQDAPKATEGAAANAEGENAEGGEKETEAEKISLVVNEGGEAGEIVLWVADEITSFTAEQAKKFLDANPDYAGYKISIEGVGEGDAASNMITDVEGGADLYGFAQDQLARLVSSGALTPIMGDNAAWVADQNDAGAAAAATLGDQVYAFPITSDNGYFLYYDKSVVSDPSTLEGIIKDCEEAGKGFYFELNSGWYQTAFFFGNGCQLTYDTDAEGKFTVCNVDYASDAGIGALKAMIALSESPAFNNGSSISKAANAAAVVSGTWDSGAAKDLFGDNYACCKLPTFDVDGTPVQMSGFGGFKLLGVKPQTEPEKLQACLALAKYLTSEEVQVARYEAKGWGPSNKAAQQNEKVKADEALSALADQLQYTIPQGQYPNDYWTLATSLGDSIISGDYKSASDEELMNALQSFQDSCISYAQ